MLFHRNTMESLTVAAGCKVILYPEGHYRGEAATVHGPIWVVLRDSKEQALVLMHRNVASIKCSCMK